MSAEAAFEDMCARLYQLGVLVRQVRTTTMEDRPMPEQHVMVDHVADTADALAGWLAHALDAALDAQQALVPPESRHTAVRALVTCQNNVSRALETFVGQLVAYDKVAAVLQMGYERDRGWRVWAHTVVQAINDCQQPLLELNNAVFRCCLELTLRANPHTSPGVMPEA
jgi:hypothetical protein